MTGTRAAIEGLNMATCGGSPKCTDARMDYLAGGTRERWLFHFGEQAVGHECAAGKLMSELAAVLAKAMLAVVPAQAGTQ